MSLGLTVTGPSADSSSLTASEAADRHRSGSALGGASDSSGSDSKVGLGVASRAVRGRQSLSVRAHAQSELTGRFRPLHNRTGTSSVVQTPGSRPVKWPDPIELFTVHTSGPSVRYLSICLV